MKKTGFILILCLSIGTLKAQVKWGVKGGLNYNQSEMGVKNAYQNMEPIYKGQQANNGWHIGLINRSFLTESFFLQFEGLYSETSQEIEFFEQGNNMPNVFGKEFNNQVGQLNALAGIEFFKFLRAQGGFTGKFAWDNEFSETFGNTLVGYNLGIGINLGRLNFDVAYNGSFINHQGQWRDIPLSYTDSEIVFSATYLFVK